VRAGETPGYPRFQGATRYKGFTYQQFGNGASLDNGFLVLSQFGRIAVHWSRPIEGAPKTVTISREADGYSVCFSCADVPAQPLPPIGQETGIDLGLESFATLAGGAPQEGQSSAQEGDHAPGEGTPARAAAGLPPQGSPQAGARKRGDLSRGVADGQPAQEPLPRQEHQRCGMERVLEQP
jgi:hypothetical protein